MEEMEKIPAAESIQKLLDTGAGLAKVEMIDEMLYAMVPDGYKLATNDLAKRNEEMEDRRTERETGRPLRNTGTVTVADVDSFVLMVTREIIPATTVILANVEKRNFKAIINFAENGENAGHSDRSIYLELVATEEFKRWFGNNRHHMSQMDLAYFIEENLESITDPPAGEMLSMVQNLKVKKRAKWESSIDTESGQQHLAYSEDVKGEMLKGTIAFKSQFAITVTPFHGTAPYEIKCSLRFSVEDDSLKVFFVMQNLHKIIDHAFNSEMDKIKAAMEGLKVPIINVR